MPQMKPMHWMLMLSMISLLLIITISIIYFTIHPFINEIYKNTSLMSKKVHWNWKW